MRSSLAQAATCAVFCAALSLFPTSASASPLHGAGAEELRAWLASSASTADYAAGGPELAETVDRCLRLLTPPASDAAVDSALALVTAELAGFAEAHSPAAVRELRVLIGEIYVYRLRDYGAAVAPLRTVYNEFAAQEAPDGELYFEVAYVLSEAHLWNFDVEALLAVASAAHARAIATGDVSRQFDFAMWLAKGFALEYAEADAERYYREATRLAEATGDDDDRFSAYRTLGAFLQRAGKPARALPVLDSALALAGPGTEQEAIASLWLGITQSGVGDVAAAVPRLERARELFDALDDSSNAVHARMELARAYRRGGEPDRAIALVENTMAATAGWTTVYHRLFRHDELSYAYADAGRYDSAYFHLGAHQALREELDSATHDREIRALGQKYAAARDEAILEAQAEWIRERRRYRWGLAGLGLTSLCAGAAFLLARRPARVSSGAAGPVQDLHSARL